MDDIASIVEDKVDEIFGKVIQEYVGENPMKALDEEVKQIARQRATSQLMFALSRVTFPEGVSKKDRFDEWYDDSVRQEVVNACKHCLEDEMKKRAGSEGEQLSAIDRYLAMHGMGVGARKE